jgi:sirohydrochlorin ferrochelatase
MKRALLLVDHGSRSEIANEVVATAAREIQTLRADWIVDFAHMEIASPDIPAGLEACARAGANEIVVQPWFLGPGSHIRETIPAAVAEAAQRHPDVLIRIAEPFGADAKLIELVIERADIELG